jgi:hypothetical protein
MRSRSSRCRRCTGCRCASRATPRRPPRCGRRCSPARRCRTCASSRYDGALSIEFLDALVDSRLFRRLEGVELHQGALEGKAIRRLISRKADLAHLEYLDFGEENRSFAPMFADQLAAASTFDRNDE